MYRLAGPLTLFALTACGAARQSPEAPVATDSRTPAAPAATAPASEGACTPATCRSARELELEDGSGRHARFQVAELPYVHGEMVTLLVGDEIAITGERVGDRLTHLRVAQSGEPSIRFSFRQGAPLPPGAMGLMVTNGFADVLRYRAEMQALMREELHPTSTCPVLGGGRFALESWPHPIGALHVSELRFVAAGSGDMGCN